MNHLIALFGESEKGTFRHPYLLTSLPQAALTLGNPPIGSFGLHFAVQTLLYDRNLLFFRVEEEGFAPKDYMAGLSYLKQQSALLPIAICLPGASDCLIINETIDLCKKMGSFLIMTEKDLFDYLTS